MMGLLRRAARIVGTLVVMSAVLFGLMDAFPGDPTDTQAAAGGALSAAEVAVDRARRGADGSTLTRWWNWMVGRHPVVFPPSVPAQPRLVVEQVPGAAAETSVPAPAGGRAFAARVALTSAGVLRVPVVATDGVGQEGLGFVEILIAPPTSPVPTPAVPEGGPTVGAVRDEAAAQLAGSTEDALGVGRAPPAALAAAAREEGPVLGLAFPAAIVATDGAASVPRSALVARPDVRLTLLAGPGELTAGGWRATQVPAGQHAVVLGAEAGATHAWTAFLVVNGAVENPQIFQRGVAFTLLGDPAALGRSSFYGRPVWDLLFAADGIDAPGLQVSRSALTALLLLVALGCVAVAGLPLAAAAGLRPRSAADRLTTAWIILSSSVPGFWLGLVLVAAFAVHLGVLPAGGAGSSARELGWHLVLPAATLGLSMAGPWLSLTRVLCRDLAAEPYMRAARARGIPLLRRVAVHLSRNAAGPLLALLSLQLPLLFTGSLLVETVFSWPGVARLQYEALLHRDDETALAIFLVNAAIVLVASNALDALAARIDPRGRERATESAS